MRNYLLLILLVLAAFNINAQSITLVPFSGSYFCPGTSYNVAFYASGYGAGLNVIFDAQLSDSSGSFANPIVMGAAGITDTIITAVVPLNTVPGSHYRMRIESYSPSATSNDNGADLGINAQPAAPVLMSNGNGCPYSDTLTISGVPSGALQISVQNNSNPPTFYSYPYTLVNTLSGGDTNSYPLNQMSPEGVIADKNGYIYVSDEGNGRVLKFPPGSGADATGMVAAGNDLPGSAINQLNRPFAITLDTAGNLYVADGYNNRVMKFPPNSVSGTNGTIVAGGNGRGSALNQLNAPYGMCLDYSGYIYVSDNGNNRILKFPPNSTSSTNGVIVAGDGKAGGAANQLNDPQGICIDTSGNIYIADYLNNRIQKFPQGSDSSTNGQTIVNVPSPGEVFVDKAGNIYFSTFDVYYSQNNDYEVLFYSPGSGLYSGYLLVSGGSGGVTNYDLKVPAGIYVNDSGNIYISDWDAGDVLLLRPQTLLNTYVPTAGATYTASYISNQGCISSHSDSINITITDNPTITINATKTLLCASVSDTFTSSITEGGANPIYQWYKNGIPVGSDTSIYIATNLNNGDSVWATLTNTNSTCDIQSPAASNHVLVTIAPIVVPSVAISYANSCPVGLDSFTAVSTNDGADPEYYWILDGNLYTYGPTCVVEMSDNDSLILQMYSSALCANPDYVNSTVTIHGPTTPMLYSTGNCIANDTLTLTGISIATRIYWYLNGSIIDSVSALIDSTDQGLIASTIAGGNGYGSAVNQLDEPDAIFFDKSGNLYVADMLNNRVQQFPPNSTSLTNGVTVAGGNGAGSAANQLNNPTGLFIDSSGYLYVSDQNNNRIQKFPPGSTSITNAETVAGGNDSGSAPNQINAANDVYLDSKGNIYVADGNNYRVLQFPAGSTSATNGVIVAGGNGLGSALNQFWPGAIFVDAHDTLYVEDGENLRILKFPPGSTSATFATVAAGGNGLGSGTNQMEEPSNVFGDSAGNIYVTDAEDNWVLKFPPGSSQATYGVVVAGNNGIGNTSGRLNTPTDAYVDSKGDVFVSDAESVQKWQQFSKSPALIYYPKAPGMYTVAYRSPSGCLSPQSNSVYLEPSGVNVSISGRQTLYCGAVKDTFIATVSSDTGDTPTYYWYKNGVQVSAGSTVYISSSIANNDSIWITVSSTETCTSTPNESNHIKVTLIPLPTSPSLTVNKNDSLFLNGTAGATSVNWYLGGILVANDSSQLNNFHIIAGGNGQGNGANQFNDPSRIFVDKAGNVYVSDAGNNRVQKFPPGSTSAANGLTVAGGNGPGQALNQLDQPEGIFVDDTGNLYVTDKYFNRIIKYPPGSTSSTFGVTVAGVDGTGYVGQPVNLASPEGVFVDSLGDIYVADLGDEHVVEFPAGSDSSYTGNPIGAIKAVDVFVDDGGNVYASVSEDGVYKFPPGSGISTQPTLLTYVYSPGQLSLDKAGDIFVADIGDNEILEVPAGKSSIIVIAGLPGNSFNCGGDNLNNPSGVFVDDNGYVYIVDAGNNRVLKSGKSTLNNSYFPLATGAYTATYTDTNGCVSPSSNVINVDSLPVFSTTITATQTCTGNRPVVLFTAYPSSGSDPYYIWEVNGSSTGLNASTFIDTALNTNDSVWVYTFENPQCLSGDNYDTSNRIYLGASVSSILAASVAIAQQSYCTSAGLDTFIAIPTFGGAPFYQWYENGSEVGINSPVYTTQGVAATDSIWVVMTTSLQCLSPLSATSAKTFVFPTPAIPALTLNGSGCAGSDTLDLNAVGGSPQLYWYRNGTLNYSDTSMLVNPFVGGNGYGNASYQFDDPWGVFVDKYGTVYVSDNGNTRVQKFTSGNIASSNGVTVVGGPGYTGSGLNQILSPVGIAVDSKGDIYVSDQDNARVMMYPPGSIAGTDGAIVAGGNGAGNAANQLDRPNGIFLDKNNNLYVSDQYNHRIVEFPAGSNSATNGITVAGGNDTGHAANQIGYPTAVCVDINGYVYVSDDYNRRIQKFPPNSTSSTNGITVAGGNGEGYATNQLSYPGGIAVDSSGNLYVIETDNFNLLKFPPRSTSSTYGVILINSNPLTYPYGMFLDPRGNIFVTSYDRIVELQMPSGMYSPDQPGNYTARYITPDGCSSPMSDAIAIGGTTTTKYVQICTGQSYDGHDTSGIYTDTFASASCDSLSTLYLTVTSVINDTIYKTITSGSYLGYSQTGIYRDTFQSSGGCDSIQMLFLTVYNKDGDVWPGDANSDGIANNYDLLSIGLAYVATGSLRPNATNNWVGQPCPAWADTFNTGVNFNHADCDGNGTVDANDTVPILLNYNQTHQKGNAQQRNPGAPPLYLELVNGPVLPGNTALINIFLGDSSISASNVYGLAFGLLYNNTLVQANSVKMQFLNSWLGMPDSDLIGLQVSFPAQGQIDFGITRIDHTDHSGSGAIAQMSFISNDTLGGNTQGLTKLVLNLSGVLAIDHLGKNVPVDAINDTINVLNGIASIEESGESLSIYPNPASETVTIVASQLMEEYAVYNPLGMEIIEQEKPGSRRANIDISSWAKGIYFLQATINGQKFCKPFAVMK